MSYVIGGCVGLVAGFVLGLMFARAPEGYEDETGFHRIVLSVDSETWRERAERAESGARVESGR